MSKQSKQYESMRQTQANTFSDGLNMDLHPLTTPNTILTDCVNGTMITYNDNEFVLQNERGNNKIKIGDTEHVKLSEGFIPVGMKEHNGILYIVSHNPQTKQSEIGTYPSPNKIQEYGINLVFEGNGEIKSNYTEFDQNITYYDYNTIVTNQDNYTFSSSHNPLVVLEHFILNKTGEVTKTKLIGIEGTETYRFTHEGEGILGYRYRPYYLSSITPSIIPSKGGSDAQLIIEAISDDKELYEVLKTQDDVKFKYDVVIEFVNGKNKLEFNSTSLDVDKWDYTFNLTNVSKLSLPFENKFTIENKDGKIECEYNYRTGELITNNSVDNTSTNYKEVNFNITPRIYTSDDNYIIYDNLITSYKTTMDVVFKQESWFTTFKYKPQDADSNKLSIWATLDLSRFDIDWVTNVQTINEASYKLYEIDKYGNIKGKYVNKPFTVYKSPLFDVVDSKLDMKSHDLVFNDKLYNFSLSDIETLIPIQYSNITTAQCMNLTSENKARYVRYDKIDEKTYNIVLLNANYEELSSTNIYSDNMCSEDMKKMIVEYFDKTNGEVNYTINDVPFEYNKVYLLELTFPINGKINKASFIIVTAQSMLKLYSEDILNQRMDEILLNEWFEPEVHIEYHTPIHSDYRNPSSFANNLIDVERIKNMPTDDNGEVAEKYAKQFFLKYNQLFTNPNDDEIPAIGEQFECIATITNESPFECIIDNGYMLTNQKSEYSQYLTNKLSLKINDNKSKYSTQNCIRNYLYTKLNNTYISNLDGAYYFSSNSSSNDCSGAYLKQLNYRCLVNANFKDNFILTDDWMSSFNDFGIWMSTDKTYWQVLKLDGNAIYGATTRLMQKLGMAQGLCYNKLNTKNRIWLYYNLPHTDKYILCGISEIDDINIEQFVNTILKHGYYLKPTNRTVYQYNFLQNDENDCLIAHNKDNIYDNFIKVYPCQCMAMFNDYNNFNIQSWNNLSTLNLENKVKITGSEFGVSYNELNVNYNHFLNTLGKLINLYTIPDNDLNVNYIEGKIYFDSKLLFIDNINKINLDESTNYTIDDINLGKTPPLFYNEKLNIISVQLSDNANIEYIGPMKWNKTISLTQFWDILPYDFNKLNDYHSLLFYKLTAYNGEQQS